METTKLLNVNQHFLKFYLFNFLISKLGRIEFISNPVWKNPSPIHYVDGLFTCHIVGWKRIPPNRIRGKLFPIRNQSHWYLILKEKQNQMKERYKGFAALSVVKIPY